MTEDQLINKLKSIERLHAGATTEGERDAAARAVERIRARLKELEKLDPPVEYKFSMKDMYARRLFVALLRRYGIRPYRFKGQRYTTVMALVSKSFLDETLWPEFQALSSVLRDYLNEVTNRVITEGVHSDSSEAEVRSEPSRLI
ncbi:MAG: hypothetical protein ACI8W8_001774 [Rhodothermales bacterium]|jgi:hypothetical protein